MPSTATITAFYSFTANTKAKASQVNTNFSNFRGHIVAIDPNTTTAINETYDLGSTEYRWRTGYFREIDLKSNTTTGQSLQIVGDTSSGNGKFNFHIGSTIPAQVTNNGFEGYLYGSLNKPIGITTTASYGQISKTVITEFFSSGGGSYITGLSITHQSFGRPIEVMLKANTGVGDIALNAVTATVNFACIVTFILYRSSTVVDSITYGSGGITVSSSYPFHMGHIVLYDFSAPSGSNLYRIKVSTENSNASLYISSANCYVREI